MLYFIKIRKWFTGCNKLFLEWNKSYSKERIEIYENGKNIIIDNFMKLYFYGYNEILKAWRDIIVCINHGMKCY